MTATDTELDRVLNAIAATLADQKVDHLDIDRLQQMAIDALGGERKLVVEEDPARPGQVAWLKDASGERLASIVNVGPRWQVQRESDPAAETYVPPKSPGRLERLRGRLRGP